MKQENQISGLSTGLRSIQWTVFMLTNVIAVPIVVGAAFHMGAEDIAAFMQRMLFITGAATLVQNFFGHRLPVVEGAAGMWWALFILLGTISAPGEQGSLLQQLEMGLIVSGAVLILISLLPVVLRIRELFTPLVTGVYLILLVSQMSGGFFKSMLGISMTGHLDGRVASTSLAVIVLILMISLKAKGIWKSMGPLFGIALGWTSFHLFGIGEAVRLPEPPGFIAWPKVLDWGMPQFDFGVVLTSVLTAVILLSNVTASILVGGKALDQEIAPVQYRKGIFGNGVNLALSGLFSVTGTVPLTVSGGFISMTGLTSRRPFVIGAFLIMASGLLPYVSRFLSLLPLEVAYASLFIPFAQMMGFGIRDLMAEEATPRNLLVIGLSLMVGIGMMFLPPQSLESVTPWLRNILANGLLVGLLLCLLLEHVVFRKKAPVQAGA